jgi:hypothetical protein
MSDFDDSIAWLKDRRKVALEDIIDYTTGGMRQYRNNVDITDKLVERAKADVSHFDILIAAYESHNG